MSHFGDLNGTACFGCFCHRCKCYSRINGALSRPSDEVDWKLINPLLLSFMESTAVVGSVSGAYASNCYDPMGRLLLSTILSKQPPVGTFEIAIRTFPLAIDDNPSAFLMATMHANDAVLKQVALNLGDRTDECPYPWILASDVSIEHAKRAIEAFPLGITKVSPFLGYLNLLDYFLFSNEMTRRRTFDEGLWKKFKLVLVAYSCSESPKNDVLPIHTLLRRVMSRQEIWNMCGRMEHVLWLLHQLRSRDCWTFQKQSIDGSYPVHVVLACKCTADSSKLVMARELVKILLEACPVSARCHGSEGKLPLHAAVANGWPCHDLLLAVFPEALDYPDPSTRLLPFQAAAKNHHSKEPSPISLDVTYELLRANPVQANDFSMHVHFRS